MRSAAWLTVVLACASAACVGSPPPPPGGEGSGSTSVGGSDPTGPVTTAPVEDTGATAGGTGTSTSTSADDGSTSTSSGGGTTMGVDPTTSGSGGGTSSGGESSGGPPPPECIVDGDCPSNELCDAGACVDACGGVWGASAWGSCLDALGGLDTLASCGAGSICLSDAHPWSVTMCSAQSCVDACDCPAPPATGNATVTCASITVGDMTTDCYLSCENGETCPDGMECTIDSMGNPLLCMVPVPANLPVYGNCDDLDGVTCDGGSCGISSSSSVCTEGCPGGAGDCTMQPFGLNAPQCADVFNPPGGNECFLPCVDAGDCPPGGSCIDVPGPTNACMF